MAGKLNLRIAFSADPWARLPDYSSVF